MAGARRRGAIGATTAVLLVVLSGATMGGSAFAVGSRGVLYSGRTSQGKAIKLVTDRAGVPRRGAFDVVTGCSGDYKPFSTSIRIEKPFRRSSRAGFKEKGHRFDTDGTYSGRYRWKVDGERKTPRKFEGTIEVEIVFRRDERKYTTCTAEDVTFKVKAEGDDG